MAKSPAKTLNKRLVVNYENTFDEMKSKWLLYPVNSIIYTNDGPVNYCAAITFKLNDHRCLSLTLQKNSADYIYTRFSGGSEWSGDSGWRKIPLLKNDNIVCNNIKADNETRLKAVESNKSDKGHTHVLSEITDYTPYDDTEVRSLIAVRPEVISYETIDNMIDDWNSIPDNSIAVSRQGADQWSATFTYKYNTYRALTFTVPKDEKDFLWTMFMGESNTPWSKRSVWRKIPVLTTDDNLVCNNVKADNERRLKALEDTSSVKGHTHTVSEIVDYEPYDDSDVRALIDTHTHTSFKDITLNGYTNMKLSVEGSSNSYIWPLRVFDDILENGQNLVVGLGKAQNSAQCAIMYYHQDESNPYFCLGLHSNDIMKLYKDKVEISKPITNMLSIVDNGNATKWSTNISVTKPAMTDGNCLQIYIGKEISAKKSG